MHGRPQQACGRAVHAARVVGTGGRVGRQAQGAGRAALLVA